MDIKHFFHEFKLFILKRNAVDMALGIILGVSFGKVISSLVNDIVTPPIGLLLGGAPFSSLKIVLKQAIRNNEKILQPEVAINYGHFLETIIDFIIVAFTAFLIIKFINKMLHAQENQSFDWSEYIKK